MDKLNQSIQQALQLSIQEGRKTILNELIEYIQKKRKNGALPQLHFICTHNSRRSQFSQIWSEVAANYFKIPVKCFSGGAETTAVNERVVESLIRSGFSVNKINDGENPVYEVNYNASKPIKCFSKLIGAATNPTKDFAAIMTCSDADKNCPFVPGCEKRIPLRYEDPKIFDNTNEEAQMYDTRSLQIASELFYVFSKIK